MYRRFRIQSASSKHLTEEWISRSRAQAQRMRDEEDGLRSVLEAHASVASAAASLRLAWGLLALTGLLIVVALIQFLK
jgi:type VI protein secretion system component VasF